MAVLILERNEEGGEIEPQAKYSSLHGYIKLGYSRGYGVWLGNPSSLLHREIKNRCAKGSAEPLFAAASSENGPQHSCVDNTAVTVHAVRVLHLV